MEQTKLHKFTKFSFEYERFSIRHDAVKLMEIRHESS